MKDFFETETDTGQETEETESADSEAAKGELTEILLCTREQGQMIEALIQKQIEVKDALIDKLHAELDYYKHDAAERYVDQVMKGLIKVRKDLSRQMQSERFQEMDAEELRREYAYIYEDLTDLLEQQNIDAYRSEPGDDFDPAIHQPKVFQTDDPALDRKVKESISEGYRKKDKILQPERVAVYQYKEV